MGELGKLGVRGFDRVDNVLLELTIAVDPSPSQGFGFRVQGAGCRVQGAGCRGGGGSFSPLAISHAVARSGDRAPRNDLI